MRFEAASSSQHDNFLWVTDGWASSHFSSLVPIDSIDSVEPQSTQWTSSTDCLTSPIERWIDSAEYSFDPPRWMAFAYAHGNSSSVSCYR